jgi:hypothetical protein
LSEDDRRRRRRRRAATGAAVLGGLSLVVLLDAYLFGYFVLGWLFQVGQFFGPLRFDLSPRTWLVLDTAALVAMAFFLYRVYAGRRGRPSREVDADAARR